jgi:hypothetical protein
MARPSLPTLSLVPYGNHVCAYSFFATGHWSGRNPRSFPKAVVHALRFLMARTYVATVACLTIDRSSSAADCDSLITCRSIVGCWLAAAA